MITFIILAAVLTFAVAIAIAIPLLRRNPAGTAQAPWTAFAVVGVLVFGSISLYAAFSNWSWRGTDAAAAEGDSPQAMVARLEKKLEDNPQDMNGWLMLGRSYMVLEQYPRAMRAYERADRLADGKNAEALTGIAESMVMQDETELEGRAGPLVERALELDPKSGKALFFGAAIAIRQGNLPLARERFTTLLALNPPDNVKTILQQQIAAIDQELSGAPPQAQSSPSQAAGAPEPAGSPQQATGEPTVRVSVALSPKLDVQLSPDAPLFVIVRDPNQRAPLAVRKLSNGQLPLTVELTNADAMAGPGFSAGQQVKVVARISRSGGVTAQSGDPFGEALYQVGRDGVVQVLIDRLTP
jgi:cytochrome c-type biogenesis protein CcmH